MQRRRMQQLRGVLLLQAILGSVHPVLLCCQSNGLQIQSYLISYRQFFVLKGLGMYSSYLAHNINCRRQGATQDSSCQLDYVCTTYSCTERSSSSVETLNRRFPLSVCHHTSQDILFENACFLIPARSLNFCSWDGRNLWIYIDPTYESGHSRGAVPRRVHQL